MAVNRTGWIDERAESAHRGARIGFVAAGAALVLGALLPWAGVSAPNGHSFSLAGLASGRDGWLTLAAGVVILVCGLLPAHRRWIVVGGAAGLAALVAAIVDWTQLLGVIDHAENTNPSPVHGAIGWGLWLTVVAAGTTVGLACWYLALERPAVPRPRRARR